MSLASALLKLDDSNPDHWTDDGLPRIDVLKQFGSGAVTRAQIAGSGRLRRNITPQTEVAKPSAPGPAIDTVAAVADAQAAVDAARARLLRAEAAVKTSRAKVADALMAWIKLNPAPDQMQVARDHAAKDRQRKQDIALGLIEPNAPPVHAFPVDQNFAARKRSRASVR